EGAFREDLYYRLNVIPIRVPPLRERRADIALLAQHFLDKFAQTSTPPKSRLTLAQDAQQALMTFAWPGNVRQLENAMERMVALSGGRSQITLAELPEEIRKDSQPMPPDAVVLSDEGVELERLVAQFEHTLIKRALERTVGNKRQAADLLHIKRTTLIEKLKRLERQ